MVLRCCPALVLLLLALATPAAAQPWYEHYERAEQAIESEDWEAAVAAITRALELRADSASRVRTSGMRFTTYFPYLKLGIAYSNLDQPEAALQAFAPEEQLGVVAGSGSALAELTGPLRWDDGAR